MCEFSTKRSITVRYNSPPHSEKHAHLVGVCGAGMKALAEVLIDRGWSVSGSDASPDPATVRHFQELGIEVLTGHRAEHVPHRTDSVVYSPAVPPTNVEMHAAQARRIPRSSYVDSLVEFNSDRECVAVAGTHGKSSTTAILGHILTETGHDPTIFCGAQSVASGRNGRGGAGPFSVVEACEYRSHFLSLPARHACLLSVEPDHFDCFPTMQASIDAYRSFVQQIPSLGRLVINTSCPGVRSVMERISRKDVVAFSLNDPTAEWSAKICETDTYGSKFEVLYDGHPAGLVHLKQPGHHNVANALAAIAMAVELGSDLAASCLAVGTFQGLKRRFEELVTPLGLRVIDDYAHHPTEIQATLKTARSMHPNHEIVCVFQPHQVSRTESLMEEFAQSFYEANEVYVLPVFGARESCQEKFEPTSRNLVERISHYGTPASYLPALDRVWPTLDTDAAKSASRIVLTLGAGDITRINNEFYRTIR